MGNCKYCSKLAKTVLDVFNNKFLYHYKESVLDIMNIKSLINNGALYT